MTHGISEEGWEYADDYRMRWKDREAERWAREQERKDKSGAEVVSCPVCGGIATVVPSYVGGYGRHFVAWCEESDGQHRTPIVRDRVTGQLVPGRYQRTRYPNGDSFRIVPDRKAGLRRALRQCLGESDLAAARPGSTSRQCLRRLHRQ